MKNMIRIIIICMWTSVLILADTPVAQADTPVIAQIVILALLSIVGWGIYLGLTKKAVFYMNKQDVLISVGAWAVLAIGGILSAVLSADWLFLYIVLPVTVGIIIYSAWLAYHYNQSNLYFAIPVGIAKVLLSLLLVLTAFSAFNGANDNSVSSRKYGMLLAIIAGLTGLLWKLTNGREVYEKNGWEVPEDIEFDVLQKF